jgi:hypothetical protein
MTISKHNVDTKLDEAIAIAEKFVTVGSKNTVNMSEVIWSLETISEALAKTPNKSIYNLVLRMKEALLK